MKIRNFAEVNAILSQYAPPPLASGATLILDRMERLMNFLGNPQEKFKAVHVAGTSGKTSTVYYIAGLLKASGKKVGLTVSPHIDEVNERVQIDLVPLPEDIFAKELGDFLEIVEESGVRPTYFELLIAFAYWEFAKQGVDYGVIEVGLGGLLDATNIIKSSNKVAVITDIGLDHMHILGSNLSEIAAQKAGIIRPGNEVFTHYQSEEALGVITSISKKQAASLHVVEDYVLNQNLRFLPLFQQRNFTLALYVFRYLSQRDDIYLLSDEKLAEAAHTLVPARMEVFEYAGKTIVLDGAHNAQKMQALAKSIKQQYPDKTIATLLALVQNPDFKRRTDLKEITNISDYMILTSFNKYGDMKRGSIAPQEVALLFEELEYKQYEIVEDASSALASLLDREEPIVLITGSFYLLGYLHPLILDKTSKN